MTASPPSTRPYTIESVEVLAQTPELRMSVFTDGGRCKFAILQGSAHMTSIR
ncbi:MAG: hypothetical protein KGJ66_03150 [Alphaproteobacteria bacterium]|nr:hypothetical protein [Alphaproteobacteria bacterium]